MLYSELRNKMREFNSKHGIERKVCQKFRADGQLIKMVGKVVFKTTSLNQEYQKEHGPFSLEERTFVFDNYNKALTAGDGGYSIFADCPFDNDCMRIENYNNADVESAEIIEIIE